jgi:hypothetical protein
MPYRRRRIAAIGPALCVLALAALALSRGGPRGARADETGAPRADSAETRARADAALADL